MARLRAMADPRAAASAARFGIKGEGIYGIPMPRLRAFAREIGKDHRLALQLWETGSNSARHLAVMIDHPALVTEAQMEAWVRDFNSWDVCDGACWNFFDRTPFAWKKAIAWTRRRPELERRAGYVLIAGLAPHDTEAPDRAFLTFLPIIERGADDDRNFVKKAVNWALREIGKRSRGLNRAAVRTARAIRDQGTAGARWIAADALRELSSPAVQERLGR
ncbi:MAG: DNA alkylation repair protein [bacterium]